MKEGSATVNIIFSKPGGDGGQLPHRDVLEMAILT